jgi:hypothetical protein
VPGPDHPVYVVSKGRWESRLTARALDALRVPYRVVVEAQERDAYAAVIDPARLLVLDPAYQRRYDTCDGLGDTKSKGPGPARNFAWEHSAAEGHRWHWVMDDNIKAFYRFNRNLKVPVADGAIFCAMEAFTGRFANAPMSGPNYFMFAPRKSGHSIRPFTPNTRVYSCNLIRNDLPFRWRGRYNEDTDLSLRILKAGMCTILFNAFLAEKLTTQSLRGGNTDEFYALEGTLPKSRMLVGLHPDVAKLSFRWGRWHHVVDYRPFAGNRLVPRPGAPPAVGADEFGMRLVRRDGAPP